ncbi:hypothetical protein [Thermomonas sp.]|uniref:hypothetical protein n=1 Tax=Thermomonas sp. TaxID=1971895 RepID=UPI00391D1427
MLGAPNDRVMTAWRLCDDAGCHYSTRMDRGLIAFAHGGRCWRHSAASLVFIPSPEGSARSESMVRIHPGLPSSTTKPAIRRALSLQQDGRPNVSPSEQLRHA